MSSKDKNGVSYGVGRTRNFATLVYPDSAPDDWQSIIADSKISVLISPLHDNDYNKDGTPKKPHYHVIAMFSSVKTVAQAKAFFETFNGVGCEAIASLRGYARYLCHLDNPDKAYYRVDEVVAFSVDYIDLIFTSKDRFSCVQQMIDHIEKYDITSYADIVRYAMANRRDWFYCLVKYDKLFIRDYIKSTTWKKHKTEFV